MAKTSIESSLALNKSGWLFKRADGIDAGTGAVEGGLSQEQAKVGGKLDKLKRRPQWVKRWFVVEGGSLAFYKRAEDAVQPALGNMTSQPHCACDHIYPHQKHRHSSCESSRSLVPVGPSEITALISLCACRAGGAADGARAVD